ncbi:tRNA-dihydrouridine synthase, partial [Deinococcus sp.]|uniref:tRNA-dihydrouridine synthase n=1 Tax=Deinococcus sp. TaxID=47478 RepID=UPI0028699578
QADWEAIARVAAAVDVPVVGSGDVTSADIARERQGCGVAAVMIGRGAVGNPWIFTSLAGGVGTWPDMGTRARTALRHAELQTAFYDDDSGRLTLRPLRKVLPAYLPDVPEVRDALVQVVTVDDVRRVLAPLLDTPASPAVARGAEDTGGAVAGYAVQYR